jgi:hypothetical protein
MGSTKGKSRNSDVKTKWQVMDPAIYFKGIPSIHNISCMIINEYIVFRRILRINLEFSSAISDAKYNLIAVKFHHTWGKSNKYIYRYIFIYVFGGE